MRRFILALSAALLAGAATVAAQAGATLDTARSLYASARYEEALAVLNGLPARAEERRGIEHYRSLCLLALNRGAEAEAAIAALVTADPMYLPSDRDASPRVRATFGEVRRRMLPEIATARYAAAKAKYDQREWADAAREFEFVVGLLRDADMSGRLPDLRVLAEGFLELSARNAEPPPAPEPVAAVPASPPPAVPAPNPPAPEPSVPEPGKTYTSDDEGVVPPAIVKQDIPSVPAAIMSMAKPRGLLEIVVDERGRVVSMAIRGTIHPAYDTQLLTAARDWKYQPATVNGQPVRFKKLIQVAVRR